MKWLREIVWKCLMKCLWKWNVNSKNVDLDENQNYNDANDNMVMKYVCLYT